MKIAVCVKQVPLLSKVGFDYENKRIIREGVPLEVNVFDLMALDRAVRLKSEVGARVTAVTMGPPQAKDALAHCLAAGADDAILISDRAMAGSDTLATARTLSMALKDREFDLIFCGRNSTDAETGQVGPEMAEFLGWPHVSRVRKLDYDAASKLITVERVTDEGYEVIQCALPAVVTADEGLGKEVYPRRQAIAEAQSRPVEQVTASQLSVDASVFGTAGSPTVVAEIRLLQPQRLGRVIEDPDPVSAARKVVEGLREKGATAAEAVDTPAMRRFPGRQERAVWVMVERSGGQLRQASFEILGAARELAQTLESEVVALIIGEASAQDGEVLAAQGADRVMVLETDGAHVISPSVAATLAGFLHERRPYALLAASTANGRDVLSRVAARLGLGLTGDCIGLETDVEGRLVQLKPALGGNVVAPILSKTTPYLCTLRPGVLEALPAEEGAKWELERLKVDSLAGEPLRLVSSHRVEDARGAELEKAHRVVGMGMGVGGPEGVAVVREAARRMGASVAATRNVTDAGWLPKQVQVGLTGRAIAPEVYVAVGIRGAFNHMVGLQKAECIVAINNNARHPIAQAADFTIVGDWRVYLPPLGEALGKM
ncbi:MAG: electron transfer flavoprotein alpha/ beta subunit [SAR202 cluster bacterium]|nr:electron transfer flavoprotein alpha/ beta subunit [SAR202 cluster bacterium]